MEIFSLADLRKSLKQILYDQGLITAEGNLRSDFVQLELSEATQQLVNCINKLCSDMNLGSIFLPLITHFKEAILNTLKGMKQQKTHDKIVVEGSLERLAQYLKSTSQEILKRNVEIVYYDKSDNTNAHTYRGSNIIYFNKRNISVTFFTSMA